MTEAISAFVVSSIECITTDFITCNSGTCAGEFTTNGLSANSVNVAGGLVASSVTANSGLFPVNITTGSFNSNSAVVVGNISAGSVTTNSVSVSSGIVTGSINANSGAFVNSLTLGGESVLTESMLNPDRYCVSTSPVTITNMPSELNLFGDSPLSVQKVDLSNKNEIRFLATQTIAGSSNARMRANYSTSFGTTAADYSGSLSLVGTNGGVELDISTGNSVHDSGWLTLNPAAKAPIYLGVVISGGNGMSDPVFGSLIVEFR